LEIFHKLFSSDFLPHGSCYLWNPQVVWLHAISDLVITLSYYCIPVALVYLVKKRNDIPFNWILWMFALFILGCGTTHLMEVWTIWHPTYLFSGLVKAFTAATSIATAVVLFQLLPKALALPSVGELYSQNRVLEQRLHSRMSREKELTRLIEQLESKIKKKTDELEVINTTLRRELAAGAEAPLRHWASAATAIALLVTGFVGFLCWRSVVKSAEVAGWVAHTQEVRTALQSSLRHADDIESGSRAFAITGEDRFLQTYDEGRRAAAEDINALRLLIVDNPVQEVHLNTFESQVNAKLAYANRLIARRRELRKLPEPAALVESDQLLGGIQATIASMDEVERKLLDERTQQSLTAQHKMKTILVFATLVGPLFLLVAGTIVSREVNRSILLRGQLKEINADLERRVEQRTFDLQQSEERYRLLFDGVKDYAIYMLDPEGNVLSWNEGAARIKGYSSEEIVGKHFSCFYTTEAQQAAQPRRDLEKAIRNGKFEEEGVRVRKDGSTFSAFKVITPLYHENTVLRGFSVIARDITERVRNEEILRERTLALELAPVVIRALDGRIAMWNQACENLYGYSKAEAIGALSHDLLRTSFPKPLPVIEEELRRNGTWDGELVHLHKDGRQVIVNSHWALHQGRADWPVRVVETNIDITARKEAERQLAELNRDLEKRVNERTVELQAANKELEAFTYSVSHDLRAPLRHIAGFSRMLADECAASLSQEARHYLRRIQDGVHRMGLLVDDLLNLTRIGRHEIRLQVIGLDPIVKDVIADLSLDTESRDVQWKIGHLPFVEGDPALLKVVFQNLLSNALKYSRPRAKAVIEVGSQENEIGQIIFVRDNGVGFSMKYADKLFGVFQRLHRPEDFEGTGVGLATVQRVIQKHSGRIWAEAEIDKGATFYFTLGSKSQTGTDKQKPMVAVGGSQ